MVTQRNFSMKNVYCFVIKASRIVGISYSTAKKIFAYFRSSLKTSETKKAPEEAVDSNLIRTVFC